MSIVEKASCLRDKLVKDLSGASRHLLNAYPLHRYVEYLTGYPQVARYAYLSPEVRAYCDSIRNESSTQTLETYHKLLLVTLILRAQEQLETRKLPMDIGALYQDNFERILRDIELDREAPGFYLYPKFCKELALCTMRLIPAGPQKICLHGLPRSYFLRTRPGELLRAVRLLLGLGGFKPVYEMHTDSRDLKSLLLFTPDGWTHFYRRVAALMELHPAVRGVVGTGWFFDPALERISPELAYLRQLVVHNGGTILRLGACGAVGIQDATQLSPIREQLYLDGKYVPTSYVVVWPRKELIGWANSRR